MDITTYISVRHVICEWVLESYSISFPYFSAMYMSITMSCHQLASSSVCWWELRICKRSNAGQERCWANLKLKHSQQHILADCKTTHLITHTPHLNHPYHPSLPRSLPSGSISLNLQAVSWGKFLRNVREMEMRKQSNPEKSNLDSSFGSLHHQAASAILVKVNTSCLSLQESRLRKNTP